VPKQSVLQVVHCQSPARARRRPAAVPAWPRARRPGRAACGLPRAAGLTGSCRRWTTCCSAARTCCRCTPTCPPAARRGVLGSAKQVQQRPTVEVKLQRPSAPAPHTFPNGPTPQSTPACAAEPALPGCARGTGPTCASAAMPASCAISGSSTAAQAGRPCSRISAGRLRARARVILIATAALASLRRSGRASYCRARRARGRAARVRAC